MATRVTSNRREYEHRYPFKVDLPKRSQGYGRTLDAIILWCRDNTTDHSIFGRLFYFMIEDDAARFRERWGCLLEE